MITFELGKRVMSGYFTTIDDEDADLLSMTWSVIIVRGRTYARHAFTENGKQKALLLHRVILERQLGRKLTSDEMPDHKDNNPLNNTRGNLRLATRAQNSQNQGKAPNNTSGYKGVSFHKGGQKWQAHISFNAKHINLGLYETPEEAYGAYCEAAVKYHGEFANLDTPAQERLAA